MLIYKLKYSFMKRPTFPSALIRGCNAKERNVKQHIINRQTDL